MRASLISCYFLHYFQRINHAISLSPGCLSWKDEFRRLYFLTPWDGNINNDASPKGQRPPPWIDNCMKAHNKALEYIQASYSIDNTNAVIVEHLADILKATDQISKANLIYMEAIDIGGDSLMIHQKMKIE